MDKQKFRKIGWSFSHLKKYKNLTTVFRYLLDLDQKNHLASHILQYNTTYLLFHKMFPLKSIFELPFSIYQLLNCYRPCHSVNKKMQIEHYDFSYVTWNQVAKLIFWTLNCTFLNSRSYIFSQLLKEVRLVLQKFLIHKQNLILAIKHILIIIHYKANF